MSFNEKCIEDAGEEINEIFSSKPVLLIGSAISSYSPTGIPSGMSIVNKMYDFLFEQFKDKDVYCWFKNEFNDMPFEALNDCFPEQRKKELPELFYKMFSNKSPNRLHQVLAQNLNLNRLSAIVTPNYDLAFENCLGSTSNVTVLCTEKDCEEFITDAHRHTKPVLFKIHGTITNKESLIFSLEQEKRLQPYKESTLSTLLKKRTLIVAGYSGRDFDICPIIAQSSLCEKIIWLRYYNPRYRKLDDLSEYAKYVLSNYPNNHLIIRGALNDFLSLGFRQNIDAYFDKDIPYNPREHYKLSPLELSVWQLNVLNRLACPSLGRKVLEDLRDAVPKDYYYSLQSQMCYYEGKYAQSLHHTKDILSHQSHGTPEFQFTLESIAASEMGNNNLIRSWIRMKVAKKHVNSLPQKDENDKKDIIITRARILHREIIYYSYISRLLPWPLSKLFVIYACHKAKSISNYDYSLISWPQRQGIKMAVNRIKCKNVVFSEKVGILDSQEGFQNLGLPAHVIIAFKQELETMEYKSISIKEQETVLDQFNKIAKKAINLGINSDTWKLYRAKFYRIDVDRDSKIESWKNWMDYQDRCEYGTVTRIYLLLQRYIAKAGIT